MVRAAGFRALCCALALIGLLAILGTGQIPSAEGGPALASYALPYRLPSAQARADLELAVLNLMNQERVAEGLAPLVPHAGLRSAARGHGLEMFAYGYFSHRSRNGYTPAQRILKQRVRVRLVGENLAYAPDVVTAQTALMASEDHRKNILSPQFGLVGIGVIDGGSYGVIIVQDFSDAPISPVVVKPVRPLSRPAKNAKFPAATAVGSARVPAAQTPARPTIADTRP
jgi:uncharacterized protein YkwD